MSSLTATNVGQERQQLVPATLQPNQSSSLCSALVNVIISFPGISHSINAASIYTSPTEEPNTVQITIQGNHPNLQTNIQPQEDATAPTAQIHMPQGNIGLGEQQVSQVKFTFCEL